MNKLLIKNISNKVVEEKRYKKIKKIAHEIKIIKIQWATKIAKEAFKVMANEIQKQNFVDKSEFFEFFDKWTEILINARSTEPMLFNGMKYAKFILKHNEDKKLEVLKDKVTNAFNYFLELVKHWDKYVYTHWSKIIKDNMKIMTHCHASSVVKLLKSAVWWKWREFEVFNTETRPLFQWRKTSKNLLYEWIKTTMVTDSSAPYFVDNTVEKDIPIDVVIIGCDAIKPNWDVVNKVWSFSIAMSAYYSKIPVYIVWNLLKTDYDNTAVIERRDWHELRKWAPKKLNFINLAFDTVPAKFITWIITEFWIIKPKDVKKFAEKNYSRLIKN